MRAADNVLLFLLSLLGSSAEIRGGSRCGHRLFIRSEGFLPDRLCLRINAAGAEQKQGSLPWRSEAVHLCPLSEISHSGSLEVDYLCVFPLNA